MTAPRTKGMGPGFWPVTIVLTLFNVAVSYWIVTLPIDQYLRVAAEPAEQIDNLFKFLSVIGNAIFVYVIGYLVFFSVAWRRRATDPPDAIGIQIHDNPRLEFWWTLIPAILLVILGAFSVQIWARLQNTLGDVLTMEAIGHQFNYEFRYPRLKASVYNDMHLPVGTPVTLHVTSGDVIHSFWVPEVRLKMDMVPGLINTIRFTPTKIGTYRIICTEFCGRNHSEMVATLHIDSQQNFGRWLAAQYKAAGQAGSQTIPLAQGVADQGRVLFGQKCSACHSLGGFEQKIVGPGLGHLTDDPAYPKLVTGKPPTPANIAWILQNGYAGPIGVMPNQQANALSAADISNLTAYLVSLK